MTTTHRHHSRSAAPVGAAAPRGPRAPISRLLGLGAAGLTAAAIVATPAPALAHDTLVDSTPQGGASAEQAPGEVELSFSSPPQDLGAQIRVTGPDGADVADGEPEIQGTAVVQDLADTAEAPGDYSVVWRVVSSDGHPIEGAFDYTVAGGSDAAATDAETGLAQPSEQGGASAAESQPAESGSAGADAQAAPDAEESEGSGAAAGWLIVGGGVVVLGAVAAAIVMMRRMSR